MKTTELEEKIKPYFQQAEDDGDSIIFLHVNKAEGNAAISCRNSRMSTLFGLCMEIHKADERDAIDLILLGQLLIKEGERLKMMKSVNHNPN